MLGAVLTIAAHPDQTYANASVVEKLGAMAVGSDLPLAAAASKALKALGPRAGEHLPDKFWSWEPQRNEEARVETWFEVVAATRPDATVAVAPMFRIGADSLPVRDTPDVLLRAFAQLRGEPARLVRARLDRASAPIDRAAALNVLSTLPEGRHTFSLDEAHELLDRPRRGWERFHLLHLIAARTSSEPGEIARLSAALRKHDPHDRVVYWIVAARRGAAGGLLCSVPELDAVRFREMLETSGYHPSMACAVIRLGESTRAVKPRFDPFGISREVKAVYDPTPGAYALARMGEPGFAMLIRWFLEPFRGDASDIARKRQTAATQALADHSRVPWPIFDRLREQTRTERTDAEVRLMARFGRKAATELRTWAEAGDERAMRALGQRDADLLLAAATNPEHPAHEAALLRAAELHLEPERIIEYLVTDSDLEEWTGLMRGACLDECIRALADLAVARDDSVRRNALRALGEMLPNASKLSESTRQAVTHAIRTNWNDRNYGRDAKVVTSRFGRGAAGLIELLLRELPRARSESVAAAVIHSGVARRYMDEIVEMSKRSKRARGPIRVLAAIVEPTDEDALSLLRVHMDSEDFTVREIAAGAVARHSVSPREILRARGLSWYGTD